MLKVLEMKYPQECTQFRVILKSSLSLFNFSREDLISLDYSRNILKLPHQVAELCFYYSDSVPYFLVDARKTKMFSGDFSTVAVKYF